MRRPFDFINKVALYEKKLPIPFWGLVVLKM